jgi:hypothetical protein
MFGIARRRASRAASAEADRLGALARQLDWLASTVRECLLQRRMAFLVGALMLAIGLLYLGYGVIVGIDAGWHGTRQVRGGRSGGHIPLWFVLTAFGLISSLLIAGGVGTVMAAQSALRRARLALARFQAALTPHERAFAESDAAR